MPHLRFSRARYSYECADCGMAIARNQHYFRDEPHPFDRMRGKAVVRQLCVICVLGQEEGSTLLSSLEGGQQLPLGFEPDGGGLHFAPRVELLNFTPQKIDLLAREPEAMRQLNPEKFETLIGDILSALNFGVQRVGDGTFHKDGGIDYLAWSRDGAIPFLLAVQAKHTTVLNRGIGPAPVRDLLGAVQMHGLNAGLLVTNTTFTPDARWVAEQRPMLMRLRDGEDLRRWLRKEHLGDLAWRGLPRRIEVCPGVVVTVPR